MKFLALAIAVCLGAVKTAAADYLFSNSTEYELLVTLSLTSGGAARVSVVVPPHATLPLPGFERNLYFTADVTSFPSGSRNNVFSLGPVALSANTGLTQVLVYQLTATTGGYVVNYAGLEAGDLDDQTAQRAWTGFTAGLLLMCVPGIVFIALRVLHKGIHLTNQ